MEEERDAAKREAQHWTISLGDDRWEYQNDFLAKFRSIQGSHGIGQSIEIEYLISTLSVHQLTCGFFVSLCEYLRQRRIPASIKNLMRWAGAFGEEYRPPADLSAGSLAEWRKSFFRRTREQSILNIEVVSPTSMFCGSNVRFLLFIFFRALSSVG